MARMGMIALIVLSVITFVSKSVVQALSGERGSVPSLVQVSGEDAGVIEEVAEVTGRGKD